MSRSQGFKRVVWLNEKEKRQDAVYGWVAVFIILCGIVLTGVLVFGWSLWYFVANAGVGILPATAWFRLHDWEQQEP